MPYGWVYSQPRLRIKRYNNNVQKPKKSCMRFVFQSHRKINVQISQELPIHPNMYLSYIRSKFQALLSGNSYGYLYRYTLAIWRSSLPFPSFSLVLCSCKIVHFIAAFQGLVIIFRIPTYYVYKVCISIYLYMVLKESGEFVKVFRA